MTYLQAVNQACKLAKKNSREYFVVDDGSFSDDSWLSEFAVASTFDAADSIKQLRIQDMLRVAAVR